MNKRVEIIRFSDGILKQMSKKYPDFKGCLYEYNGSCIVMALVANLQLGLQKLDQNQNCVVTVQEKLLQSCFDLLDIDIYDFSTFDDLEIKFSYTRDGVKVHLPLITTLKPSGNQLDLTLNPDFYQVLQTVDISNLDGLTYLEKCKKLLQDK